MTVVDDDALDGNAIGGLLLEVFGTEMTAAVVVCGSCGASGPMAETVVFLRAPGTVVRCRSCAAVLMVVVRHREQNCVDMLGIAGVET
jgi:ribosomal protein S27E